MKELFEVWSSPGESKQRRNKFQQKRVPEVACTNAVFPPSSSLVWRCCTRYVASGYISLLPAFQREIRSYIWLCKENKSTGDVCIHSCMTWLQLCWNLNCSMQMEILLFNTHDHHDNHIQSIMMACRINQWGIVLNAVLWKCTVFWLHEKTVCSLPLWRLLCLTLLLLLLPDGWHWRHVQWPAGGDGPPHSGEFSLLPWQLPRHRAQT